MATYLNATDLDVRLDLIADYISEFGNTVSKNYLYGQKCAESNFKTLALLTGYVKVLSCYQPITGTVTEDQNCITEAQAQAMFDHISFITKISLEVSI